MPLNDKHEQLLDYLGIGKTANHNAYMAFIDANSHLSEQEINIKLHETIALAKDAKEFSIKELAKRGKSIKVDPTTGQPKFNYDWDLEHNEYRITYTIDGINTTPKIQADGKLRSPAKFIYPCLSGGPGEIRIATFECNNAMQFTDILGRCRGLWKDVAADLCIGKNSKEDFALNQKVQIAFNNTSSHIKDAFLTYDGEQRIKVIKRLMQDFVSVLAMELILSTQQYGVTEIPENVLQDKIQEISRHEDVVSSNKQRGLYVKVFPQIRRQSPGQHSVYMRESLLAMSNVSSNKRDAVGRTLSNWFKVNNTSLKVKWDPTKGSSIDPKTASAESYRSSSFDILDDVPGINKTQAISEMAERTLKIKACDGIIERIIAGDGLPKDRIITVNTEVVTLLSPILRRDSVVANAIARVAKAFKQEKIARTLQETNELAQLESTAQSMEHLFPKKYKRTYRNKDHDILMPADSLIPRVPPIKLDDEDIKYILDNLPATISEAQKSKYKFQLKKLQISHKNLCLNFPSNLIGGKHAGDFDIYKFNRKYNLNGIKMLNTGIFNYAQEHFSDSPETLKFLKELFRSYNIKNPESKTIPATMAALNSNIHEHKKNAKQTEFATLMGMLGSYVIVQNELQRLNDAGTRVIDSNVAAVHARKLASALGFTPHTTCKSGNDRTGVSFAFEQSDLSNVTNNQVYDSLAYGAGPHVTACNVVGANYTALQIDKILLAGLDERTLELLDTKRREGQLAGDIYKCPEAIEACRRKYGVASPKSSNRRSFNRASPPATPTRTHSNPVPERTFIPSKLARSQTASANLGGGTNPTNRRRPLPPPPPPPRSPSSTSI